MTSSRDDRAARVVDAYVRTLAEHLRGPRAALQAMTDEVRDHLFEAIEQRSQQPQPYVLTVDSIPGFGSPSDLAARLQPTVDRHIRHRALLSFVGLTAAVSALWLLIFLTGPPAPWSERAEPWALAWIDVIGATAMKVAVASGFAALGASWGLPRLVRWRAVADVVQRSVVWTWRLGVRAFAVSVATIVLYAAGRGILAPTSLEWSDVVTGALATAVMLMVGFGLLGSMTSGRRVFSLS